MIYKLSDLNRKNFKAKEFYNSNTALKHNINNTPVEQATLENLDILADKMQEVRDLLKLPIVITSGFRCLELNQKLTASAKDSFHMYGLAADFVVRGKSPREVVKILSKNIVVDKAIASYMNINGNETLWTHLQIQSDLKHNRNLFLTESITQQGIKYDKIS